MRLAILILFSFFCQAAYGQDYSEDQKYWKILSKISYKKEYNELLGFKVDKPIFSSQIKKLDGQEIQLLGYIIPTEGYKSHKEFIFSAFPYNMCFFCGGAGPETVIEVSSVEEIKYTSDPILIRGRLVLNQDDINRLMYALTEVVEVK